MNTTIKQQSLFWGIVLFAIMFIFMINTGNPAPQSTQTIQYYQSEWTSVPPAGNVSFQYSQYNQMPSFYDVYVALRLNIAQDYTTVVPYRDMPVDCLRVVAMTPVQMTVRNNCDESLTIQTKLLFITP